MWQSIDPIEKSDTEPVFSFGIMLRGGFAIQLNGLPPVGRDSKAILIENADHPLSFGVS